ncbi:hypothetical protein DSL72_006726 [Monilinia vaccinii-corymbosi]|uniref:Uncharacterized protein n=1 Tax=Monilinia vaccinii-corymbosi TaxID=61207 RepID=A0A8A3PP99_9HELO|nr:hypothetical protein DSL72_006726 [Monilinia vaccinii-corymbosi]
MPLKYDFAQYGETETLDVTALALASALGEPSIFDLLLDQNANIDEIGPRGLTPLHFASIKGRKEVVAHLLEAHADSSLQDNNGNRAFHHASIYGHLETLQLLYQRGSRKHINRANIYLNVPLHLASLNSQPDTAKWLLDSGAAINQTGHDGNTPLNMACMNGDLETVDVLLDKRADIHKRNNSSFTPVLVACLTAHLEIFLALYKRGALLSDVTSNKNTCFHLVVGCNQEFSSDLVRIMEELVGRGEDINQPNIHGQSPLFYACVTEKPKNVECPLRFGADINQVVRQINVTPLMGACGRGNSQITKMLLQHDADTTIANNHGVTALGLAIINERLESVKLLINKGANATVHDNAGRTPVQHALMIRENIEIALEVLAAEEYYPQNPSVKSHYMERPADVPEIEAGLLKGFESGKYETLKQLYIIMYWAVSNGALELATKCIDHNQQVLQWIREGATWLHIASKSGTLEATQLLLDRMKNQREQPDRPAGWATVEAILQHNSRGDSPLTISIDRGHHRLQEEYWSKIRQLHTAEKSFIDSYPAVADQILELLATYEKPGHETILGQFLYKEGVQNSENFTTLHWAVYRSQAVVVWWLLSKCGYSSDEIKSASKLVPDTDVPRDAQVRRLFLEPPPALEHVANPNRFPIQRSPKNVDKIYDQGNVLDTISGGKSIKIPFAKPSVYDTIYGEGPESIMKKAREDLRQRDLDSQKRTLRQPCLDQDKRGHAPYSGSPGAQSSSFLRPWSLRH